MPAQDPSPPGRASTRPPSTAPRLVGAGSQIVMRPAPYWPCGDDGREVEVLQRVVLGAHRQALDALAQRRALGHGPGGQRAVAPPGAGRSAGRARRGAAPRSAAAPPPARGPRPAPARASRRSRAAPGTPGGQPRVPRADSIPACQRGDGRRRPGSGGAGSPRAGRRSPRTPGRARARPRSCRRRRRRRSCPRPRPPPGGRRPPGRTRGGSPASRDPKPWPVNSSS